MLLIIKPIQNSVSRISTHVFSKWTRFFLSASAFYYRLCSLGYFRVMRMSVPFSRGSQQLCFRSLQRNKPRGRWGRRSEGSASPTWSATARAQG